METQPLPLDSIVELLDQYSNVYPLSPTGARGWVRARREFPKMDPEVYIEWDKTHWRYHGERDGWTYEHHFRPVEDVFPDAPSDHQILEDGPTPTWTCRVPVLDEVCPNCGEHHDPPTEEDQFLHTLLDAQEAALDADAFFIVTLTPRVDGELVIYEPEIYTDALTQTARQMIEAQLVHVAAQLFDRHMLDQVNDLGKPDEPGQ